MRHVAGFELSCVPGWSCNVNPQRNENWMMIIADVLFEAVQVAAHGAITLSGPDGRRGGRARGGRAGLPAGGQPDGSGPRGRASAARTGHGAHSGAKRGG